MVSKKVKVVNPSGLHLRPAGVLSQTAMKFKSRTLIECGEKHIVAKSVTHISEPEGDIAERQKLQLCRYPFLDGKEGFLWN